MAFCPAGAENHFESTLCRDRRLGLPVAAALRPPRVALRVGLLVAGQAAAGLRLGAGAGLPLAGVVALRYVARLDVGCPVGLICPADASIHSELRLARDRHREPPLKLTASLTHKKINCLGRFGLSS